MQARLFAYRGRKFTLRIPQEEPAKLLGKKGLCEVCGKPCRGQEVRIQKEEKAYRIVTGTRVIKGWNFTAIVAGHEECLLDLHKKKGLPKRGAP